MKGAVAYTSFTSRKERTLLTVFYLGESQGSQAIGKYQEDPFAILKQLAHQNNTRVRSAVIRLCSDGNNMAIQVVLAISRSALGNAQRTICC